MSSVNTVHPVRLANLDTSSQWIGTQEHYQKKAKEYAENVGAHISKNKHAMAAALKAIDVNKTAPRSLHGITEPNVIHRKKVILNVKELLDTRKELKNAKEKNERLAKDVADDVELLKQRDKYLNRGLRVKEVGVLKNEINNFKNYGNVLKSRIDVDNEFLENVGVSLSDAKKVLAEKSEQLGNKKREIDAVLAEIDPVKKTRFQNFKTAVASKFSFGSKKTKREKKTKQEKEYGKLVSALRTYANKKNSKSAKTSNGNSASVKGGSLRGNIGLEKRVVPLNREQSREISANKSIFYGVTHSNSFIQDGDKDFNVPRPKLLRPQIKEDFVQESRAEGGGNKVIFRKGLSESSPKNQEDAHNIAVILDENGKELSRILENENESEGKGVSFVEKNQVDIEESQDWSIINDVVANDARVFLTKGHDFQQA